MSSFDLQVTKQCVIPLGHAPTTDDVIDKPEVARQWDNFTSTVEWLVMVAGRCVKYRDIAKFARHLPHRYGNSRAIWDHTVLPATRHR